MNDWANKNLSTNIEGLVGALTKDQEYVSAILSATYEIENELGNIPASIQFVDDLKGVYAKYMNDSKSILIPSLDYGILEAIAKDNATYLAKPYRLTDKFHIIENFKDLLIHEIGHAFDIQSNLYYTKLIRSLSKKEIENLLKISGNSRDEIEKFADSFLSIVQNKKESKHVSYKLKKEILKILSRGK